MMRIGIYMQGDILGGLSVDSTSIPSLRQDSVRRADYVAISRQALSKRPALYLAITVYL